MSYNKAFSLIEVLLAVAVIAIALTALLKVTSQDISYTRLLKERAISHWVAKQGINMVQLGLLTVPQGQEITQATTMLGEKWYWRVHARPSGINHVETIEIKLSHHQSGPFNNALVAFRYAS